MLKTPDFSEDAPWKKRFRAPVVASTQIAEFNPERGLAVTNSSGVFQLHAWDVKTGTTRQVTNQEAGVIFGGISPDGEYIYYLKDTQGNEVGHYVRVPFAGGDAEDITPDWEQYASFSLSASLGGDLIGFTVADAEGFKLYTQRHNPDGTLHTPQLLYHSKRMSFGPMLSYDGDFAVIATTERSEYTDFSLMVFHLAAEGGEQQALVFHEKESSLTAVGFAPLPGDTRFLATTNVSGFDRPLVWDVKTGDVTDIPLNGKDGDFAAWGWSPDGKKILLCQFLQARYQLYTYDLERSTLDAIEHPSGSFGSGYFADDNTIYVTWQNAVTPAQVIALKLDGSEADTILRAAQPQSGHTWKSVELTASDGQKIQAWLAVPEGEGPFPAVVHIHGGPTAVQTETFSPGAQSWLDHGFAFISVNYRGSTTFGREFQLSILGNLGHHEVNDVTAAHTYLVENNIAVPDSILVTGGSYGGYLTLHVLGKRPELWAGGMALVAIADWNLMYEDQAETLRGYQHSLFGGGPEEKGEQFTISSPITYADDVRAPLLVIQGSNDTRCPARQMRVYEEKMQSSGKDFTIHWFDAGHGSRAMEQNIEHQELMLRWAYRVLG